MATNIQLKSFAVKATPVSTDIIYAADSANSFDEVQITIQSLASAISATTPTASTLVSWDANKNISANNFIYGSQSIVTAAGSTTLTVASPYETVFTGSTTQTCVMPVVSTLAISQPYLLVNASSGAVTVNSSGGNLIATMAANTALLLNVASIIGTSASSWQILHYSYTTPSFLGIATATSINFGGSPLSIYTGKQSWIPVFTFSTLGNLSVAYGTQSGSYTQIGDVVTWSFILVCTPTFTTSSGNIQITGLPSSSGQNCLGSGFTSGVTFPAGTTSVSMLVPNSQSYVQLIGCGSATAATNFISTNFVSGNQVIIEGSGSYLI